MGRVLNQEKVGYARFVRFDSSLELTTLSRGIFTVVLKPGVIFTITVGKFLMERCYERGDQSGQRFTRD